MALRHQLQVLQRTRPRRVPVGMPDRWLWVWLSRVWTEWRRALVIVEPATVVAWHRRGLGLFRKWKSRPRTGRPSVPKDVRELIRMMSEANPLWGAPRIHGELLKVGVDVSQATVAKYMVRLRRPPSQTWRTFLANHIGQIMAADFFVVPTATCRLLFVLVIIAHARRRLVHVAVTDRPTAAPSHVITPSMVKTHAAYASSATSQGVMRSTLGRVDKNWGAARLSGRKRKSSKTLETRVSPAASIDPEAIQAQNGHGLLCQRLRLYPWH
ncbi:MAG: hypothetical protein ACRD2X_06845 [Vicinamibacteraceae bacterium]